VQRHPSAGSEGNGTPGDDVGSSVGVSSGDGLCDSDGLGDSDGDSLGQGSAEAEGTIGGNDDCATGPPTSIGGGL